MWGKTCEKRALAIENAPISAIFNSMSKLVNNPNPKHVVSFILTPDLRDRLGRVAKANGLSKSWLARAIFEGWLSEHESEVAPPRAPNRRVACQDARSSP